MTRTHWTTTTFRLRLERALWSYGRVIALSLMALARSSCAVTARWPLPGDGKLIVETHVDSSDLKAWKELRRK